MTGTSTLGRIPYNKKLDQQSLLGSGGGRGCNGEREGGKKIDNSRPKIRHSAAGKAPEPEKGAAQQQSKSIQSLLHLCMCGALGVQIVVSPSFALLPQSL